MCSYPSTPFWFPRLLGSFAADETVFLPFPGVGRVDMLRLRHIGLGNYHQGHGDDIEAWDLGPVLVVLY